MADLARVAIEARQQGDFEAAESALSKLAGIAPEFAPGHLNLGLVRYERGDFPGAAAALKAALALDSGIEDLHSMLGHSLLEAGDRARALDLLEKALETRPDDPRLRFWLARARIESGRAGEADEILGALRTAVGDDPELLRLEILRAGSRSGQLRIRLVDMYPRSPAAMVTAAEGLTASGRREEAVDTYRAALQAEPGRRGVRLALGDLLFVENDLAGATGLYREEAALAPFATEPLIRLGDALLMQGNSSEAEAALEGALALDPDSPEALEMLARARSDQGDHEAALGYLLRALESGRVGPDARARVHYQLGRLYRRLGRPDDAQRHEAAFDSAQAARTGGGSEPLEQP